MGLTFFYRILDYGDDSVEQIYAIEDYIERIIQTVQTYERVNGHHWNLTGERQEVFVPDEWRPLPEEDYGALEWWPTHSYEYESTAHSPYVPVSTSAAPKPAPKSAAPTPAPTPTPKPEPESSQFPIAIAMGLVVGGYLALR